jgi:protein-S-isoprenylcysteine O-methyltransferase Ste14
LIDRVGKDGSFEVLNLAGGSLMNGKGGFFEGQIAHFVSLIILLVGVFYIFNWAEFSDGQLFGLSTNAWFWFGIAVPIVHQIYVLIVWRLELYGKHISNAFGANGFIFYCIGFSVLILLRPVSILLLGLADYGSLALPLWLSIGLGVICLPPAIYLMYSIKHYFGFKRAFGIDHFDASYRGMPLVKKGIFRFSNNGMYIFGFMMLWGVALLTNSAAGLLVAAFNHAYIWVHYFFVEKPDMNRIYG